MFGRNFTQFENSIEEAFCLGRIACFDPLDISRFFRRLCQHQAHAVNHQSTKFRTPDFYNRQNGTPWESGTFPIKFFPFNLYEYVLNRQLHVWEKPSTNKKKTKQATAKTPNSLHILKRTKCTDKLS